MLVENLPSLELPLEPLEDLEGECTPPSQAPLAPPPSPLDPVRVTLQTLGGTVVPVTLSSHAKAEELKLAVERSPLGFAKETIMLAANGRLLRDSALLEDLGITSGSAVDVIRATSPPEFVRIECDGYSLGPSIRGSCGTFRLMPPWNMQNGRPVYVRDAYLSRWNKAIQYHGAGERYLLFEDHPTTGKRWALTDDQQWDGYGDSSYAFVSDTAPHPGYLESQKWHVYRDAKFFDKRTWVEHSSLRLRVEDG